jgi:O-antigen ligase
MHISSPDLPPMEKSGQVASLHLKTLSSSSIPLFRPENLFGLLVAAVACICLCILPADQYWNFRIPLYLVLALWTILRPRFALYLLPFAIPWGTVDPVQVGGSNSADILIGLLTASWLLGFALRPLVPERLADTGALDHERFNTPRYLTISAICLLLAMLLSMTVAFSLSTSLKEIVKWVEAVVILLLGMQYVRTRRQLWTIIVLLCIASVTMACYGYMQEFLNIGPSSFVRDNSLRVYGTFGQPNPFAGYINMTLMITLALTLLARSWRAAILAGLVTLCLFGVEYFTNSKGGLLALAVTTLFILFVGFPRLRVLFSAAGIALLGAIEALLAGRLPAGLFLPLLTKIGLIGISFDAPSPDNYANSERVAHWYVGIQMVIHHPLLGVGIGNYEFNYAQYAPGIFVLPLGHAHNYYINMAAETGIIGLLCFLAFLIAIFVAGGRSLQSINQRYRQEQVRLSNPPRVRIYPIPSLQQIQTQFTHLRILVNDRALAIGLLAAILSVCIHNLVDNLYVHSMTSLFALLVVLLIRLKDVTHK